MPKITEKNKRTSNLERELYLLIAKFLKTGPCQRSAEVLRQEIEEHQLLPKRIDWLGNEHNRSFYEVERVLSQISDDHLLKICSRIGPILDKEIPPTVPGLTSLLGVGRQSLLRTKEDLQRPKYQSCNLLARRNGVPHSPSPSMQASYPPNITQVLLSRECSGPITSRHVFSAKIYARPQLYRRILGHLSSVYCVLFDRTGKYIFTGADDTLVKIWSAQDGRLLSALRGHSAEITDMAVNYENTLLAAGSCDKTIRVWCLRTMSPVVVLNGHTAMVTSLQFCPYPKIEDHLLVSTGNDGCVCFWQWSAKNNAFNPKPLKFTERNKAGAQMICSSFSKGGLFLATGSTDHNVRVYNIAGSSGPEKILEKEVHSDRVDSLQFSNSDTRFVSGSKDGTALIWKYERQSWTSIQLKMATKLPGTQSDEPEDTKVKLRVTMVGWTLDDSKVITAVSDHSIKVWDSNSGALCHVLKGHEDEIFVLESHPTDPRVFLSSGHDGRIIIWDLITGTVIKNHFNMIEGQGHGAVFDCKFSPDGLTFASTDSHGHLSIFGFGSADRYKKAPEEQFFHTDYRPLMRDIHQHVLDEQTQTAPHLLPPPFLVDIDGNPYPPNIQRLVPGREHCNESQLIPYVSVSAEGEAEILEPVRSANDNQLNDRPTIDDMIQRLQQEQSRRGSTSHDLDGNGSERGSSDSPRSTSHRSMQSANDRAGVSDAFSPRSTRSQGGHSRVGMRRTGDVEGVQSVGNWQSRGSQTDLPAWIKRVVVKPMKSSLTNSFYKRRMNLADCELISFNREKKRRPLPDPSMNNYNNDASDDSNKPRLKKRGLRSGVNSLSRREARSNVFGDEFENPESLNFSSSTESDSEQKEEHWSESTEEDSGSGEHSDWKPHAGPSERPPPERKTSARFPGPSSSGMTTRPRRHVATSDDDDDDDDTEFEDNEERGSTSRDGTESSPKKEKRSVRPSRKKATATKGKKLPERFRPPEWLTDVMPHRTPYVPQIGDEVMYFRQGHELYVQAVKRNRAYEIYMRSQPWRKVNLRDQEIAKIEDIKIENHPPRLCSLKLTILNPAGKTSESFTVKYHDMADVIDFIVLKQYYDQAMFYDWKPGDRFRSAIEKAWWMGTIKSQKPLNPNFPDSMFQCFMVKWDNGEREQMSPWDFEPIDDSRMPDEDGGSVSITPEERLAMMYIPEIHEWSSVGREQDCQRIARGLTRIMELSIAEPFTVPVDLNKYPSYAIVVEYPMDLGTIKARIQNKFYRRLDAVKFDVKYIEINAQKFNEPTSRIVKQAKCVVDLCIKFLNSSHCPDPMVLYHEMMEAKQSRSQDSQSELDVLCSETDSDGENFNTSRLKRKKRNALQQSSKRVRLGSQKYTSNSWKQQCSGLLDSIYQWDDSTPFRLPVSLNDYPDYRNIIDCPMDLSKVREKLDNNQYTSPVEFCKDMRLIFQNSRNFNTNKKSRIYSMTIRLSAMFEEHIRSIVSDWRSAVKYEEKIRNNQFVTSRRKPLPAAEPDVNLGASTSRSSATHQSSQRKLKHARLKAVRSSRFNSSPEASSSRSSFNNMNGRGPKKRKTRVEKLHPPKSPAARLKKKILKRAIGTSLSNGIAKKFNKAIKPKQTESQKRKRDDLSATKKKERYSSQSESSSRTNNSEPSSGSDVEFKPQKLRLEFPKHESQTRLRPRLIPNRHSQRSTRSMYSDDNFCPISSRFNHRLSGLRRAAKNSGSSTPEEKWESATKNSIIHKLSPLRTRSRNPKTATPPRLSTLRSTRQQKFKSSGDSCSESDISRTPSIKREPSSAAASHSSAAEQSQSGQSATEQSRQSESTHSDYDDNSKDESEDDDFEESRRQGRRPRAAVAKATTRTSRGLNGKPPRIQTRNRGQRTVRYEENSDDEFVAAQGSDQNQDDDSEAKVSISSRGRLRKLTRHARDLFCN